MGFLLFSQCLGMGAELCPEPLSCTSGIYTKSASHEGLPLCCISRGTPGTVVWEPEEGRAACSAP